MVELINSDFVKLMSILLAIVALFYIGVISVPLKSGPVKY